MSADDMSYVAAYAAETLAVTQAFVADRENQELLVTMGEVVTRSMRDGHKLLVAGNGGSAGDAQHIAAEFVSRMMYDRAPLPSIALTTDTSALTAIGNDYGFETIYERQVLALGQKGDVFLGISTSGRSPNIVRALIAARERGLTTMGFAGAHGGAMADHCDYLFRAPSAKTALIQQIHITAAHLLCALVERAIFPVRAAAE